MAEPLKNIYNGTFFEIYSDALACVVPDFNKKTFLSSYYTTHWDTLELKQRMAYLAKNTDAILPENFKDKVQYLCNIIDHLRKNKVKDQNLEYSFLADIITYHGLDDLETSIPAIEYVTQFVSFEFAGRAFIIKHPKTMMNQMLHWADHPNENVRRYASEGCRPRLPWGTQLKMLVEDPSPILPILEKLKDDDSLYVRKSVANNINDISKDHPTLITSIIKKWKGTSDHTDWIIKHGARTLLKKGNPEVLHMFGTSQATPYTLEAFKLNTSELSLDTSLSFSFILVNKGNTIAKFRVEYNIWYIKANGQYSKKIFKLAEKALAPSQQQKFEKTHRFQDLTTRKHYPGTHKVSIVINGQESKALSFELIMNYE